LLRRTERDRERRVRSRSMSALNHILSVDVSPRWLWAQMPTAWRKLTSWWRSELLDLLPQSVVAWLGAAAGPVIRLSVEADGVRIEGVAGTGRVVHTRLMRWADYSVSALNRHLSRMGFKRSDGTVGVVLPSTAFFHRSFEIPVRARGHVHAIARQELEHRTPFQADTVHLGMLIEPRQRDSETLIVRQTIVRRDHVEAAVRRLELPLEDIHFVASAMGDNDTLQHSVSLRPETGREVRSTKRFLHVLITAAVIIAAVDAALFWWRQERAIAAIEAETAAVRGRALVVQGLEQQIARVRSALGALERKRASLSTADLWRETSRVLPDHSWATDWRFQDGLVSMAGFSATATELVGLFEQSQLFTQASLNAPITFDAATGRERFSLVIRARVNPPLPRP
jgi:general secretion pathway protein L